MSSDDKRYIWDAFISHASEDKGEAARPLANLLAAAMLKVWFDEAELLLGDSLRQKIDHGLANSRFGIVILSPSFFAKRWPMAELDGIFSLEGSDESRLLPVWHKVDVNEVKLHSPILSGRLSVSTDAGLEKVRDAIVATIRTKCWGRRHDQPIFRGKLTKKAFLAFATGSILTSNTVNPDYTPRLLAELKAPDEREDLWQQIIAGHHNGYTCSVFQDWTAYRAHMAAQQILPFKGV